eukprot:gnl/MRDRNA2_/MRDRNA2_73129_c0_seq4.p1 gnl/MRDRNA2_/MRDRNA2_73129_c0~~gnl/MRDRNA2_/MRDRNA2_73129_c0_seq4.p1  ORF type:complete len:164 (+),score=22.56 gnl/MRDRNA2_/MRDRNA2_73129_c0_seq4:146-637(+)
MHHEWNFDNLETIYGDAPVTVGPIPYTRWFGGGEADSWTLRDFVRYMRDPDNKTGSVRGPPTKYRRYVFDNQVLYTNLFSKSPFNSTWIEASWYPWLSESPLLDVYKKLLETPGSHRFEVQFYAGPAGSGAPIHTHNPAFNTCASGRKLWLLFPPSHPKFGAY